MNEVKKYIERPLFIFAIFAAILFLMLGYLIFHTESMQRHNIEENSLLEFEQMSSLQLERLGAQVRDYSQWENVAEHLIRHPNLKWWEDNAGADTINALGVDLAGAFNSRNEPIFLTVPGGQNGSGSGALFQADIFYHLLHLARDRAQQTEGRENTVTGFIFHDGKLYYAAAGRVQSDNPDTRLLPDNGVVLAFAREAESPKGPLRDARHILGTANFALSPSPSAHGINYRYPLLNPNLDLYATWKPHDFGISLTGQLAPIILIAAIMLGIMVRYTFRKSRALVLKFRSDRQRYVELYQRNNRILEAATDGIIGIGTDLQVRFINSAALNLFRAPESRVREFIHFRLGDVSKEGAATQDNFYRRVAETLKDGLIRTRERELFTDCQKQSTIIISYTVSPVRSYDTVTGAMVMLKDVTNLQIAQAAMRHRAQFDNLTGLVNRETFEDLFDQAIARRNLGQPFHIAIFNLDSFRDVNESVGHHTGDWILQEFSLRLQNCIRGHDILARIGGDEFVVAWLDESEPTQTIEARCAAVVNACNEPFTTEGQQFWTSVSVGAASFPKDGNTFEDLLKNATLALRHVKAKGGNGLYVFDNYLLQARDRRQEIERELQHAVTDRSLQIAYQPIYRLDDGELSHFEALVRWNNRTLGFVSPGEFIPIAEDTGLIVGIGQWVFEECCRQIAEWRQNGWDLRVAVNVSGHQIPYGLSLQHIEDSIRKHAISRRNVKIELTESTFMGNSREIAHWIDGVHRLGMEIALDDFGTGFSSLSYLKKYRLQALKVDQAFIRDLTTDNDDQKLVTAILAMAKGLGMPVIAEGVETAEQLAWLKQAGCAMVQGYYCGKPSSATDIGQFLTPTCLLASSSSSTSLLVPIADAD